MENKEITIEDLVGMIQNSTCEVEYLKTYLLEF